MEFHIFRGKICLSSLTTAFFLCGIRTVLGDPLACPHQLPIGPTGSTNPYVDRQREDREAAARAAEAQRANAKAEAARKAMQEREAQLQAQRAREAFVQAQNAKAKGYADKALKSSERLLSNGEERSGKPSRTKNAAGSKGTLNDQLDNNELGGGDPKDGGSPTSDSKNVAKGDPNGGAPLSAAEKQEIDAVKEQGGKDLSHNEAAWNTLQENRAALYKRYMEMRALGLAPATQNPTDVSWREQKQILEKIDAQTDEDLKPTVDPNNLLELFPLQSDPKAVTPAVNHRSVFNIDRP